MAINGSVVAERASTLAKYALPNPEKQKLQEASCVRRDRGKKKEEKNMAINGWQD